MEFNLFSLNQLKYNNWLENELLKVIDKIVPFKQLKPKNNHYSDNAKTQRLVNKKRSLIKDGRDRTS